MGGFLFFFLIADSIITDNLFIFSMSSWNRLSSLRSLYISTNLSISYMLFNLLVIIVYNNLFDPYFNISCKTGLVALNSFIFVCLYNSLSLLQIWITSLLGRVFLVVSFLLSSFSIYHGTPLWPAKFLLKSQPVHRDLNPLFVKFS